MPHCRDVLPQLHGGLVGSAVVRAGLLTYLQTSGTSQPPESEQTMDNFPQGRIDLQEIERRAHQLRAEAARDGVKAIGAWFRARFHARPANDHTHA
jgi:hypothetical protein